MRRHTIWIPTAAEIDALQVGDEVVGGHEMFCQRAVISTIVERGTWQFYYGDRRYVKVLLRDHAPNEGRTIIEGQFHCSLPLTLHEQRAIAADMRARGERRREITVAGVRDIPDPIPPDWGAGSVPSGDQAGNDSTTLAHVAAPGGDPRHRPDTLRRTA